MLIGNIANCIFFCTGCLFKSIEINQTIITQYLLEELNCDTNVKDKDGQSPLPHLAKDQQMIRLLLKHGAHVDNVYKRYSSLLGKLASEHPPENPVSIFLIGDSGAGKSTLLKAMQSSRGFRANFGAAKPVTGVVEKTVGIVPQEIVTKEFGRVICYDFTGQQDFYASHCAFLENMRQTSPPIIIYLAHLQSGDQKIVNSTASWMTLIQNQSTHLTSEPHVIIVGSHADKVKEIGGNPQEKESIFAPIRNISKLNFTSYIPMDCRFPDSDQMKQVKKQIQRSTATLRSHETLSLNAHTFCIYLRETFKDDVAVSLKDVQERFHKDLDNVQSKHLRDILSFIPNSLPRLVEICEQLSKKGLILYLHNKANPMKSFIVCDHTTLLLKVIGTIFAPEGFSEHHHIASNTGLVPLSKLSEPFPGCNVEMLIALLSHLELCCEVRDKKVLKIIRESEVKPENRYLFFPGLVRINTPDKVWEEPTSMSCKFGWIIQCFSGIEFFNSRCLQVLILRLVCSLNLAPVNANLQEYRPQFCSVWKKGISWSHEDGIVSHLELSGNGKSFMLKVRSKVFKTDFLMVRSQTIAKVLETVGGFCPDIFTVESVFIPQEMITSNLIQYNIIDIALAVALGEEVVRSESQSVSLSQLLQFEPYAGLDRDTLQCIHSEKNVKKDIKISDAFISHLANHVATSVHIQMYTEIFTIKDTLASQTFSLKQELVHTLKTWRDKTEGTYGYLRKTLNKYSVFSGRNPLVGIMLHYKVQLLIFFISLFLIGLDWYCSQCI